MKKKRMVVRDKKLRELIKKGERKNTKQDLFELLKRSAKPVKA